MKVLVLGAGVIGTSTAWYLAQHGHEVVVLDRRDAPGMETSFANGGQISVCHAEPWANPDAPSKILQWIWRDDAPLLFRLRMDPAQWSWTKSQAFIENNSETLTEQDTEILLDDAYMPPVAAVVEHCRNSAAWEMEPAVSFRTAVVRKLADETIDGEWKGHRMNFSYLPPGQRAVAAVRQRVFSTRVGLAALDLVRSVGGRSGGRTG